MAVRQRSRFISSRTQESWLFAAITAAVISSAKKSDWLISDNCTRRVRTSKGSRWPSCLRRESQPAKDGEARPTRHDRRGLVLLFISTRDDEHQYTEEWTCPCCCRAFFSFSLKCQLLSRTNSEVDRLSESCVEIPFSNRRLLQHQPSSLLLEVCWS